MLFQENKTLKENILPVKKEKYTKKEKITIKDNMKQKQVAKKK